MSQLSLGLPSTLHVQSQRGTRLSRLQTRTDNAQRMGITSREPGTVRGTARRPDFSLAFISVTVQLWTQVFWVISVYFNIKEHPPEVWHIPPGTSCIYIFVNNILYIVSTPAYFDAPESLSSGRHQRITSLRLPEDDAEPSKYVVVLTIYEVLLIYMFSIFLSGY